MSRHSCPAAALSLLLLLTSAARAQDDAAAGLFTEARQLPLVAQSASLVASDGEARLHLVQVFFNDGDSLGQADYRLHLPQQAVVLGHGFWSGGRFLAAELKEKAEAEADHARAVSEGRASTLLRREGPVHAFSVHPVPAGEQVKVELDILLPVERALGRSTVRVPVDRFLGQSAASTSLVARIEAGQTIAAWSVEGAEAIELERRGRSVALALTTLQPVELSWTEEGPALAIAAEAVPLPEGGLAVELRLLLDDAKEWARPPEEMRLVVDGSWSMRHRAGALARLVERLGRDSRAPLRISMVAEDAIEVPTEELISALEEGRAGHATSWSDLRAALERLGCDSPARRCAVVTDPQVAGLTEAGEDGPEILLLADADELSHFEGRLPARASSYQPGVEPGARLDALADEIALPTLRVLSLEQDGLALELPARARVAEGGMLRVFTRAEGWSALELEAEIEGRRLHRRLEAVVHAPDSEAARSVRQGYYREELARLFAAWRRDRSEELKERIVTISLREGIPTAFTSLQVDDPRLSMSSIKPGDPLLSVAAEPGLVDVVAWYPFGEMRRLARDAQGEWHDRFLVPRDWPERSYRIEIFKRHEDGRVERVHAWYRLDDSGPDALLSHDREHGLLVIDTGSATPEISSVVVHAGESEHALSPAGTRWSLPVAELGEQAAVVVRDKAGNRSWFTVAFRDGRLELGDAETLHPDTSESPIRRPRVDLPPLRAAGGGLLRREGDSLVLELPGRSQRLPAGDLPLLSLDVTALASFGDSVLFGTRTGELVHLDCSSQPCEARMERGAGPPITGLAELGRGRFLVGVLGEGLLEWRDGVLQGSRLSVGTRFVTQVLGQGREVFIATAYRGLWRLTAGGLVRSTFPHDHVAALEATPQGLELVSGHGRFRRLGRDRFAFLGPLGDEVEVGSRRLTCAARHAGATWIGSFDRGLFRLVGDELVGSGLALRPLERQVDALASFAGRLWLGTQGGLLSWTGREGDPPLRLLEASVHGLAASGDHLFVASSGGLFDVREGEDPGPRRLDDQGASEHAFFAVAWWRDAVWAGGMEGLHRLDTDGLRQVGAGEGVDFGWVTALLPDPAGLLVGTYSEGVHLLQRGFDGREESVVVAKVPGLERVWVPPNGLHRARGEVWVGSLGRPPHRWGAEGLVEVRLPAADLQAVAEGPDGSLLLLGSEGLLRTAD